MAPDSELFRQRPGLVRRRLPRGATACATSRIGAIGARPAAFNTVRYSEKLLEAHGISVETVDLSEILGRIERMTDDDEPRRRRSSRPSRDTFTTEASPTRRC